MRYDARPVQRKVVFAIACWMFSACEGPAPSAPTATATHATPPASVLAIADAMVDDQFAENPDLVARLRPPGARYDELPGDSLADYAAREAREDRWRATLSSIDRASLGGTPSGLAYDIASDTLEARRQARVCRFELWSVRQMGGLQGQLADLAQAQPVRTAE